VDVVALTFLAAITIAPFPTSTPTPESLTPTPPSGPAGIRVGETEVRVGEEGFFLVSLETGADPVVAIQNILEWGPELEVFACGVNPAIQKEASDFEFEDEECADDLPCRARAAIVSFQNLDSIADGQDLYSCLVRARPGTAAGDYPIACIAPGASDRHGNEVAAVCHNGTVRVDLPPPTETQTATATHESTPAPTDVATASPTHTPTGAATSNTATPTRTQPSTQTATAANSPGETATSTPSSSPTAAENGCPGDCNGDHAVSINELILGVLIALGDRSVEDCGSVDFDGDGSVSISELIRAVNNALNADNCPT